MNTPRALTLGLSISALLGMSSLAQAHFILEEPASWIEENQLGDPQKMAPCGGTVDDGGTRTGLVTEVQGGEPLKIVINETIFHPGHYRVALARRINWLPQDPEAVMKDTDNGPRSDYAPVDSNPQPPILVDGLWPSQEKRTGPQQTEVIMPNINCEGCFLQVVQFMEEHPGFREGGFTYHHCAVVNITANPHEPLADGW